MTLEYYCKSRIRELLDVLDDAIYDHATTRYWNCLHGCKRLRGCGIWLLMRKL